MLTWHDLISLLPSVHLGVITPSLIPHCPSWCRRCCWFSPARAQCSSMSLHTHTHALPANIILSSHFNYLVSFSSPSKLCRRHQSHVPGLGSTITTSSLEGAKRRHTQARSSTQGVPLSAGPMRRGPRTCLPYTLCLPNQPTSLCVHAHAGAPPNRKHIITCSIFPSFVICW